MNVLLDQFIHLVDKGVITARDEGHLPGLRPGYNDNNGSAVLRRLRTAFAQINEGVSPEEALGIEPTDKRKMRDPRWDYICRIVHNNVKQGVKGTAINLMVNQYLESQGEVAVTDKAIRDNYKRRKDELTRQDSYAAMFAEIAELSE